MTSPCLDLEIGLTLLTMRDLSTYGLPDPDSWTYIPYSRVEIGGDGRPRAFGYPTASWTWGILGQDQLASLLDLFATATTASVEVYIWTYRDSGSGLGAMRGRFTAVISRPVDGSGKTMMTETRTPVYSDITVSFSYLESA